MSGSVSVEAQRKVRPARHDRPVTGILARRIAVLVALFSVCLAVLPGVASAESCTDTWTGPERGGNWALASDWSAGHAPTSVDVACIGEAEPEITEGANHAGVLDGGNGLELLGGSLELSGTGETSTIAALLVDGGELKIAPGAKVAGKFLETGREGTHNGVVNVAQTPNSPTTNSSCMAGP